MNKNKSDSINVLKFLLFLLVITGAIITGCGSNTKPAAQNNTNQKGTAYTVTDAQGTKVTFTKKPMRIIAQSMTFDTLLLGVVPPERLVACNILCGKEDFSFVVEETKNIPVKLTMFNYIPTDTVLKLKPDIIVLPGTAKPEMIQTFRDLGFPVLVCKSNNSIQDVRDNLTLLGKALQEEKAAEKAIAEMDRQLKEIHQVLAEKKKPWPVGMLVSQMTSYGGKGSMFDVLCTEAHVTNGIAHVGLHSGEKLTKELVIKADPDFFMVSAPTKKDYYKSEDFKKEFLSDPAYKGLRALNNNVEIPNKYLYTNSQNCVYAIKGIANYAYGNIFDLKEEKLIKGY